MWFWGIIILIVIVAVGIFKNEEREQESKDQHGVVRTYKLAWKILKLPSVQLMSLMQLTVYMSWADYEAVSYFKFLDAGVSNEKMIPLSSVSSFVIRMIVPFFVAKYSAGTKPVDAYIKVIHYRSILCLTGALIVWITPRLIPADGVAPNYIYFIYLVNDTLFLFCLFTMRIALNMFFMKVSDPAVAGTYITLLNTIDNLGCMWPLSLALWMVEKITWRDCEIGHPSQELSSSNRTNV